MVLKTPIVLTIRTIDSGVAYDIQSDGSASLSYCLPEPFDLDEPHAVKLLYIKGPKKHVACVANFIETQGFNREPLNVLGTSVANSNVYVPIRSNYITAVGWLTLFNLDGTPIESLDPTILALHLVPLTQVKH